MRILVKSPNGWGRASIQAIKANWMPTIFNTKERMPRENKINPVEIIIPFFMMETKNFVNKRTKKKLF